MSDLTVPVRVVTYVSDNAPAGYEAVARLWMRGEEMPISFHAPAADAVTRKALAWWDAQIAKEAANILARDERKRKAAETRERKAVAGGQS